MFNMVPEKCSIKLNNKQKYQLSQSRRPIRRCGHDEKKIGLHLRPRKIHGIPRIREQNEGRVQHAIRHNTGLCRHNCFTCNNKKVV